ncbi:hypothetical protein GQ44DRAFT_670296 [Phaeosphaeriaceae sp. PMI808]|nr:hypothetical protein GQ44DRAFT_670296 [Phaeosphaeriaceae sp. PMI808]
MHSPDENISSRGRCSSRNRPRGNRRARGGPSTQPALLVAGSQTSQSQQIPHTNPNDIDTDSSTPVSFEEKIALALRGSNWQELQPTTSTSIVAIPPEELVVKGTVALDVEDEVNLPLLWTAKQKKKKERFDRVIARDAGDVLQTLEASSIMPIQQNVTWDQEPELLCSYNWKASSDDTNTIFVPGGPGKWQPPTLPHTLEPDSGFQYADYNYARQPRSPYEPMFQALSVMNPGYQFMNIDVLADRNNLRVLLEFVQGRANGPFRLDLYSIFNTLVIVRNESKWWKLSDGKSYGCNFERLFTTPAEGMEEATSHYRAIRYPMGPLNIVVRFEADAYDDDMVSDEVPSASTQPASGGLSERPSFRYSAPIRVVQKGHIVPTAHMVELKTQSYYPDKHQLVSCQDQLWFGRTSRLYTGPYEPKTGVIRKIRYEDATQRIKKWESIQQENLQKLVALLAMLKEIMKKEKRPNRAVILVREEKAGPLTIRSMEATHHAVGRAAFQRHWKREQQPAPGQFGAYRGQRGSGRGNHPAYRGRGLDHGRGGMHNALTPNHAFARGGAWRGIERGRGSGS